VRKLRALGLCCVALVHSSPALAESTDANKAAAVALYDQAEGLMAAGNYAAACPKYAESHRLDPQLGALLHLADCYEQNGQLASAWARFRDAVELAQKNKDAREQVARERAASLEPKISKLTIVVPKASDVPGLEIRSDGTLVGRALWGTAMPVDAGPHEIAASAPQRKLLRARVDVGGGAAQVTYALPALDGESSPSRPPSASAPSASEGRHSSPPADTPTDSGLQRTLGWSAAALGVVAGGAGILFELSRSSKDDERGSICPSGKNCTTDERDRIESLNDDVSRATTLRNGSFIAGGLLLGVGTVLLLTSPTESRPAAKSWTIGPQCASTGLGVWAEGRW
jgi:hypothetical protein